MQIMGRMSGAVGLKANYPVQSSPAGALALGGQSIEPFRGWPSSLPPHDPLIVRAAED
jgi:hypothetical protein